MLRTKKGRLPSRGSSRGPGPVIPLHVRHRVHVRHSSSAMMDEDSEKLVNDIQ